MAESPKETVSFTLFDYVGLGFILTGIEELVRQGKGAWPIWGACLALGILMLMLRNRSQQLMKSLSGWFLAPKRLAAAHERIESLEAQNNFLNDKLRNDRDPGGLDLSSNPEAVTKFIAMSINYYLDDAMVTNSAQAREMLTKSLGYVMEHRAISGKIRVERTPIPDGWWPRSPSER